MSTASCGKEECEREKRGENQVKRIGRRIGRNDERERERRDLIVEHVPKAITRGNEEVVLLFSEG